MNKLRVLHVIARMNIGGTATYISNLLRGLEELAVECLVATGSVPRGETEDPVVATLPSVRIKGLSRSLNPKDDVLAFKEINKTIKEFQPDIIHSHTFKAGLLIRGVRRDVPLVHSFHGHHLYDPEFGFFKRRALNLIESRLISRVDKAVTIGARVRDELVQAGVGGRGMYWPISPGIQDETSACSIDVRKKFRISDDELVVMWLGRFTRVKRPDLVLLLAGELKDLKFVMAGDGELFESIRASAPDNLMVLGYQDKNEMWKLADIGLCTSDSEGMPLSLIEAQMAGVPVVSTNVGSVSEIVHDGVTGKLASNANELSASLSWVAKEIRKSKSLSRASREEALSKFTYQKMAKEHFELYREITDRVPS